MADSTFAQYAALVAAGEIERDPSQAEVVARLARLNDRLAIHRLARKSSSLGWLFGKREKAETELKGLYIWGEVGRGKTMLMDLFSPHARSSASEGCTFTRSCSTFTIASGSIATG